jgi:hypothetical protein
MTHGVDKREISSAYRELEVVGGTASSNPASSSGESASFRSRRTRHRHIAILWRCTRTRSAGPELARRLAGGAMRSIRWTKQAVNIPLRQLANSMMDLSLSLGMPIKPSKTTKKRYRRSPRSAG